MPPVGAYVSAFSVMSERSTSSRQAPRYVHLAVHSRHHATESAIAASASSGTGDGRCDGCQTITNGAFSPSWTVNVAVVVRSWPRVLTGVKRQSELGPATARRAPSRLTTQGTTEP